MEGLVVSASRTKDMVRHCPDLLAAVISGRQLITPRFRCASTTVDVSRAAALVLWTKSPENILSHEPLHRTLAQFAEGGGLLTLQLTITGFGGTFVELGIPTPQQVLEQLAAIISRGLIVPEAVTLRYDPFGRIKVSEELTLDNMKLSLFSNIVLHAKSLGVRSVVSSVMDFDNYPKLWGRFAAVGVAPQPVADRDATAFADKLQQFCRTHELVFSVCVNPYRPDLVTERGCIDARHLNRQIITRRLGSDHVRLDERLHNDVGRQRPHCRCTYSFDIGYIRGSRHCYPRGSGCLYCFSQGPHVSAALLTQMQNEVARLRRDPEHLLGSDSPYGALVAEAEPLPKSRYEAPAS